ncbi:hypothetical protein niasHS_013613 [Heterodera schachtii]|uniref:Uncharacterized protein n=1 Tax=Heterodera schachtii TaxID=97005 RepID=A0ABD2I810_HETSC
MFSASATEFSFLLFPFFLLPFFCPQFLSASSLISDYPNPLRDVQFVKCKMPRKSYVCDPEEVLSADERQKLAEMLDSFQEQTKNDGGQNGCKKKGVTVIFYGKLLNNTVDAPFRLLHQWELDNECHKAFLLTLPIDLFNFGRVAFYFATPILQDEINHLYAAEQQLFQQKRWADAIHGILAGIRKIINDRHGTLSVESGDRGGGGREEQQQAVLSANLVVAHSSSMFAHFMLSICSILASVALTLGILWIFRARIFFMRYDIPLVQFNARTMAD